MTRIGKIARIPRKIREELNRRLEDGEQGKQLVAWLNQLPEVKQRLDDLFGGRPISEQNLSEWKQGGYEDWLKHRDARDYVYSLAQEAEDLEDEAGDLSISDRIATHLTLELHRVAKLLLEQTQDPAERWRILRELLRELTRLRRDDHETARLRVELMRYEQETRKLQEEEAKAAEDEEKQKTCAPIWGTYQANALGVALGNGPAARKAASFIVETMLDLEPGLTYHPLPEPPSPSIQSDQAEMDALRAAIAPAMAKLKR